MPAVSNNLSPYTDDRIPVLNSTLDQVKNWLQWAEIKHGVFIAINSTFIFGLMSVFDNIKNNTICVVLFMTAVFFLAAAIIISLISFIPFNDKKDKGPVVKGKSIDNILYGGYIASNIIKEKKEKKAYTNYEYLLAFNNCQYFSDIIAHEIIINAQIGNKKYRSFKWTMVLSFIGYAASIFTIIGYLIIIL